MTILEKIGWSKDGVLQARARLKRHYILDRQVTDLVEQNGRLQRKLEARDKRVRKLRRTLADKNHTIKRLNGEVQGLRARYVR